MRKIVTAIACATVLAFPTAGDVWAAAKAPKAKKKVVTVTVNGPSTKCKRWGQLVVAIKVQKTITTVGKKSTVKVKILDVTWPTFPDATFRSVYINKQALPLLREEVLEIQSPNVEVISGATDITVSFKQSLQAALLTAKKP
jgi:uncharacterized protein with FMN-binding domain